MNLNKIIFIVLIFSALSCERRGSEEVIVFHAGSLSYPMKSLIEAFNQEYPDIKIINEAAGSLASARKITDLNRKADIIALADYQIVDQLLIPKYSQFNIHFATNSIGIAYTAKSQYAQQISSDNWLSILTDHKVRYAASDPDADPCGYRTRMLVRLQEKISGDTSLSVNLFQSKRYHQRPKETDLIALLETGTVDYIFLYESVSKQHGLLFLPLHDSINLSRPDLNNWYSTVSISVLGGSTDHRIQMPAEAITYGLTLLDQAPNRENALIFLHWLLNETKGLSQMKASGFSPIVPPFVTYYNNYPKVLEDIQLQTYQ